MEVNTNVIKPGQEIVMTRWAGQEGTSIIANHKEAQLLERFTKDFIDQAKSLMNKASVLEETKIAMKMGVSAIYNIGQGGVFAALWEVAETQSLGHEVDINKIPIRQETIEICEFYDLNPYELASKGCLLIITDKGNSLVAALEDRGINATVIGKITNGNKKTVQNGKYKRYLTPSKGDELYKLKEF